eukprot:TRINITY_DN77805_c0_g1_i1.p1 TRINITY_DN77805_c0_g1~~TRINITY_DN77805_c0_g1_i1.p1  ORF type:complete len:284 (+),score=34.39 TRINITY_DN77805_c0_g1_i1:73-924(+)
MSAGSPPRWQGSPLRRQKGRSTSVAQTPTRGWLDIDSDSSTRSESLPEPLLHRSEKAVRQAETPKSSSASSAEVTVGSRVLDGPHRLLWSATFVVIGSSAAAGAVLAGRWDGVSQRMALVESYRLGPLYLALVLLYLAYHTAGAQLGTVYRPTQIEMPDKKVYRILDGGPGVSGALILAQDNGAFAAYARAQQAVAALEESMPLFIASLVAAGFVLPWMAVLLSATFGLSKAISAAQCTVGLASGGRCHSCRQQFSLAGAAEGAAAGVCLFIGMVSTARELSE